MTPAERVRQEFAMPPFANVHRMLAVACRQKPNRQVEARYKSADLFWETTAVHRACVMCITLIARLSEMNCYDLHAHVAGVHVIPVHVNGQTSRLSLRGRRESSAVLTPQSSSPGDQRTRAFVQRGFQRGVALVFSRRARNRASTWRRQILSSWACNRSK